MRFIHTTHTHTQKYINIQIYLNISILIATYTSPVEAMAILLPTKNREGDESKPDNLNFCHKRIMNSGLDELRGTRIFYLVKTVTHL